MTGDAVIAFLSVIFGSEGKSRCNVNKTADAFKCEARPPAEGTEPELLRAGKR